MDINTHAIRDAAVGVVGERVLFVGERLLIAAVALLVLWALIWRLDLTINGLLVGSVYALGAVGLSLVYGNLHFPNVAHGDYMTLGAFIALSVMANLLPESWSANAEGVVNSVGPFTFSYTLLLALPIGVVVVAIVAVAIDQLVYRTMRLRGALPGVMMLASLGVAIAVRGFIQYIWGTEIEHYPRESKKFFIWEVDWFGSIDVTVRIPPDMIFVAVVAMVLTFATYAFLRMTRWGKAMRAAADNEDLARVTGIDVERTNVLTWIVGGGMAAAAGILLATGQGQLLTISGWKILIPLFAAVVAGGIGNPYGAFAGAIFVGVVGEVSTAWLEPSYKPAVFFAAIFVLLLIRPNGLFGQSRI